MGDTTADPGDTLTYSVVISNTGMMDALGVVFDDTLDPNLTFVPGSLVASPIAVNDTYQTIGNVHIVVPAGQGVITNDLNPNGSGALVVTKVNTATVPPGGSAQANTTGGVVTMSSDGSFTYQPGEGFRGPDSFTYELDNGTGLIDTATVTINFNGLIWFVNAAAASGGDGRLSSPFNCLKGAGCYDPVGTANDAANDIIFLYSGNYTGGITLLTGQKVIGQGASESILMIPNPDIPAPSGNNLLPATGGANPVISTTAAGENAINLGSDNEIWGVTIANTTGADIQGSSFGTLKVRDTTLSGNGQALSLSTGTLDAILQSISSTNAATRAIDLNTVGGSLSTPTTTVTNPTGMGIQVSSAPATATFGFGTTVVNQSGDTAISLTGNTANFTFGSLNMAPDSSRRGLLSTNTTGQVNISSGTITTTGAAAVEITKTTGTTTLGVTLTTVNTNGGPNGIKLKGTSGSFSVVGTGAAGSGGTIQNITGSDNTEDGNGIYLSDAANISLTRMLLNNNTNHAIRGIRVNTLSLSNSTLGGTNGDNNAFDEGAMSLTNSTGTNTIASCDISGGQEDNLLILHNSTATGSATFNITATSFHDNDPVNANSSVQLFTDPLSTAAVTYNFTSNCTFNNNRGDGLLTTFNGTAQHNLTVDNCSFNTNGQAMDLASDFSADLNLTITDNTCLLSAGTAISYGHLANGTASANISGSIARNIIGNANVDSGSAGGLGIGLDMRGGENGAITINNNNIQHTDDRGILVDTRIGNGDLHLEVTNNIINSIDDNSAQPQGAVPGMFITSRDNRFLCADIRNNDSTNVGSFDIRVRQANAAVFQLEGFMGTGTSAASVEAFLASQNPGNTTNVQTGGTGTIVNYSSGSCSTPTPPAALVFGQPQSLAARLNDKLNDKSGPVAIVFNRDVLMASLGEREAKVPALGLTDEQLAWAIQTAIGRLMEKGLSATDAMRLREMAFEIADLEDGLLTTSTLEKVQIDLNAANHGWFVDYTPEDDGEFVNNVGDQGRQANRSDSMYKQMDLLTVITRAMVYKLGRENNWPMKWNRGLMTQSLDHGVRIQLEGRDGMFNVMLPVDPAPEADPSSSTSSVNREPGSGSNFISDKAVNLTSEQASLISLLSTQFDTTQSLFETSNRAATLQKVSASSAEPLKPSYAVYKPGAAPAAMAGEVLNKSLGTIPPNESVTVQFQAMISDPVSAGTSQVANKATISGSNFTAVMSNEVITTLNVADLAVTKSDSPDPVVAGSDITYTINFVNNGPATALNVKVTDAVPANTTFVSASVTTGTGWTVTNPAVGGTGNVEFTKASVANGETAVFTLVVKTAANTADQTLIDNSATATSDTDDQTPTNNTGTAQTTVVRRADLSVTKTDSPDPVTAGNNITYTVNFANGGPSPAEMVALTDTVPANTTFVSAAVTTGTGWSLTAPAVGGTGNIVFSKPVVGNGETAVFTIVVQVNETTAEGAIITNSITATSNTVDPVVGNNTGTAQTTVERRADLAVTKADSPDPAFAGNDITYTINFVNNGPNSANTVKIADTVPADTTFVSASVTTGAGWTVTNPAVGGTGNVEFTKASVANGETAVFTIVVNVNGNTPNNATVTNTATATTTTTDPDSANNSATATTTIQQQADLAVTKTDAPDPVIAGQNITYTINLSNSGPGAAQMVTVTDAVPANTTFVSASVTTGAGWTVTNPAVGGTGNVVFSKASFANGETAVFSVVVKVNASTAFGENIVNMAVAATTTSDPDTMNNTATAITSVITQADLAVTKTDSVDPVMAGNNLTYTISFVNNGPSDAQMVEIGDSVPSGTTFVSAFVITGTGWTTTTPSVGGTGTVSFTKATVATGETATFEITVKVPSNTANGASISNTVMAATQTADPTSSNDSDTETTNVITRADLIVTKSDAPDPVVAGNNLTYTVSFVNNGPSDAQMVMITDGIPVNTTFVSAMVTTGMGWSVAAPAVGSGMGNIVFSKGTVVAGETATFTIVVAVNPNTADGTTINNSAVGASATTDPDPTNNTGTAATTVQARADLAVTKSDSPDPAAAGTNITYTINFVNNGPSFAQSVDVSDAVPVGTTFVSATVTTGTGWTTISPAVGGTGTVNFTKASVANGETATFTVVVKINSNTSGGTTITNSATASSTTVDPDSANNTGTAMTNVVAQADLAVTKTDTPDPVNAGQNITYTVSFVNNGPSDASTVTVTDAVPANTTFVSATVTTGTGWTTVTPAVGSTGNVVFSKGTVASAETATFTIIVAVNANTANGATITNSVTADTTTDDLTPGNDTATATTLVQTRADLVVTKTDAPDPVIAGSDITYTINFVNNGPSDAQNVTVTDAVPVNTTFVSAMITTGTGWSVLAPGVGASSGNTIFSKGTVLSGETATFTIVVKVNSNTADGTTITNNAVGASDTVDPTPGNNTGTATTAVITRVDLAVTKTDSPDPVPAGANLTYTINFSNSGPSDAQTVAVTDAVPANTTFVSATVTTGTGWTTATPAVGSTGNVVFSKSTAGATETAVFTIVVKVNSNTANNATINNTAQATTATTDTNSGNNSDSEATLVQTLADLVVVKSDSPDPVVATNNLTFTINFTNNGPSDAQTVNVSDIVPAQTTFVSATVTTGSGWTTTAPAVGSTGSTVSFTKGTVVAGETAVFTIVVNVNANAMHNSTITNTAQATTTTTDPTPANNSSTTTTTVIAQADLAVMKTDSPDPVCVDGNITYTVSFVNNGPGPGLSTTVTDAVPPNTTFVSASAPAGWMISAPAVGNTGNVTFSKGSVADDETAVFTIVVKVNTGTAHHTVITNSVTAMSSIPDPDTNNNTAMAQTTVDPTPPTITCPANVIGVAPLPGQMSGTVNYPQPQAMDNCAVASVVCNPPSGSSFPVGSTTVNCTATDTAGNTAACSFTVKVFDVCLQDDTNAGSVLLFNSFTGEYIFCCQGTTYTGTGTVSKQGGIITLQHNPVGRRVTGRVDNTRKSGTASLQISGTNLCSITDRDFRNNSCNCGVGNP